MTKRFALMAVLLLLSLVTMSATSEATTGRGVQPLAEWLNADGTLAVLRGETVNIDATGYQMVSGDGETPRFAPAQQGSGWAEGYNLAGVNDGLRFVYAMAVAPDGTVYVAGNFFSAGTCSYSDGCSGVARWNPTTGRWSNVGTGYQIGASSMLLAPNGTLYVGGWYVALSGNSCTSGCGGVLKWEGGQWVRLLGIVTGSDVEAMALSPDGNTLYIGGHIPTMQGCSGCDYIAKRALPGGTWQPVGTGTNGRVTSLKVDAAGNLYAGGAFTAAGSCTTGCNRIAKWDGTTWSSVGGGITTGTSVAALAMDSAGKLYAGGDFSAMGSCTTGCNNLARWDATTNAWAALPGGTPNSWVYALHFIGNTLYVGGRMSAVGNCTTGCNGIAQWNGSTWSSLGTGVGYPSDRIVQALASHNGRLYAGGAFLTAGSCEGMCNHIAYWDGGTWNPLGTGAGVRFVEGTANSSVYAVAVGHDGSIYVGGGVNAAGSCGLTMGCGHMARLNPTTNTWSALGNGTSNGVVNALLVGHDGTVYVGGTMGGSWGPCTDCKGIGRWNPTTNTWSPLGTGVDGTVSAMAMDASGTLYVVGGFLRAGTCTACKGVARWHPTTGWQPLGSGMPSGHPYAVAVDHLGNVYVGGYFSVVGGVNAAHIARWNAASGWQALGSGLSDAVEAVATATDGTLYVGGKFTYAGGNPARYVARWDGSQWSPLGGGLGPSVITLSVTDNNSVVAGGSFRVTNASDQRLNGVALWNGSQWLPFGDGMSSGSGSGGGGVRGLARTSTSLWAVGEFSMAGTEVSHNIARWDGPLGGPTLTPVPTATATPPVRNLYLPMVIR